MASDFGRQIRTILNDSGGYLVRQGKKHEIWYSPVSDRNFSVPRKIKSRHTANAILKQAGLREKL